MGPSVLCLAVLERGQVCCVWPCLNGAKCVVFGCVRSGPSVSCLAVLERGQVCNVIMGPSVSCLAV